MRRRELVLSGALSVLLPRAVGAQGRREVTDTAGRKVALRPIVRDFYTRCYHQAPTEAQLDQLLRTALPAGM